MEVSLSGNDTIQIAGRTFSSFADNDVAKLSFPNDLVSVVVGKNGNAVYNINASGQQADFEMRLLRGSADDRFLNALLLVMLGDLPSFVVMPGYLVKRVGNGIGGVRRDTYLLSGGIFVRNVDAVENVAGGTDAAVAVYRLKFANGSRAAL